MHCLWLVWICNFITVVVAANGTGGEKNVMVQDPNEMTTANGIISLSVVATSGEDTVDNPVEITATELQSSSQSTCRRQLLWPWQMWPCPVGFGSQGRNPAILII